MFKEALRLEIEAPQDKYRSRGKSSPSYYIWPFFGVFRTPNSPTKSAHNMYYQRGFIEFIKQTPNYNKYYAYNLVNNDTPLSAEVGKEV